MKRTILHLHRCLDRGLTLGEMLVVLLVFSILAVMLFFSSNLAITKTKLATVAVDQRNLRSALSNYEGEYYALPSESQGLEMVTRMPSSYISKVPVDPFTVSSGGSPQDYGYYSDLSANYRWMIVSVGPDGYPDVDSALTSLRKTSPGHAAVYPTGRPVIMTDKEAQDFITRYSYDPTNGARSGGDVITIYKQN